MLACAAAGAAVAILPFVLEYRTAVRMVETGALISTVAEIRNLELLAVQINAATARWQVVQEHSNNSVNAAKDIAERMSQEAKAFSEFLLKANDAERANLRLEVDKSRRMEGEWLQIIVRLLDHTYALYKAAERSGQPSLVEQLGRFQNACRDVVRRIGLAPVIPAAGEPFDPQWHQSPEINPQDAAGMRIVDTVATGYTYQGRMLRTALVALQEGKAPAANGHEPDAGEAIAADAGGALDEQRLL